MLKDITIRFISDKSSHTDLFSKSTSILMYIVNEKKMIVRKKIDSLITTRKRTKKKIKQRIACQAVYTHIFINRCKHTDTEIIHIFYRQVHFLLSVAWYKSRNLTFKFIFH